MSETAPQCLVDASSNTPVQHSIPVQEKFHLLVSTWPHSVTLRLYEVARRSRVLSFRSKSLLAEVPVTVPGGSSALSPGSGVQSIQWACPMHGGLPLWDEASEFESDMPPEPVYPEGTSTVHLMPVDRKNQVFLLQCQPKWFTVQYTPAEACMV